MRIGQDVLSDPVRARAVEWLLANSLGGSSSGTASGELARSEHGLLVAGGRGRPITLLLRLDERVSGETGVFELKCVPPGVGQPEVPGPRTRPRGQVVLEEFRLDPWPTWRWSVAGTRLEKTIFAIMGHDAVAVAYRHLGGPQVHLSASPLCVARAVDEPPRPGAKLPGTIQGVPGRVRIELAPSAPALTLWHNGTFLPARVWVRGIEYPGAPGAGAAPAPREDALVPGHVEGLLAPGRPFHLVFAAEDALFKTLAAEERLGVPPPQTLAGCVDAIETGERERLARWQRGAIEGADFTARQAAAAHGGAGAEAARRREPLVDARDHVTVGLALALRAALARRGHRRTLVASLPAAAERGVDTLRALQALVSLRAFDLVRDVLRGWVEYLDEGFAPEGFDEEGRPLYGDPAPSLWLVAAADLYARRSGNGAFLAEVLYPALEGVMQAFRQGTRHGVRTDSDGLLVAGEGGGAKRADLNALWYHALVAMAQLSRLLSHRESGAFYLAWAREHQKHFGEVFWDEESGCLYESLTPAGPVRGLSPSQLLAVSLPPALLPPERAEALVANVERELLTPWGLRESPGCHQVSVPWLGTFVTAFLRTHHRAADAQARGRAWIVGALSGARVAGYAPGTLRVEDGRTARGRSPFDRGPEYVEPVSTAAAGELLRVWIEELDRAEVPIRAAESA